MGRDKIFALLRTFIQIASGGDGFCNGMTVGLRAGRTASGTIGHASALGGLPSVEGRGLLLQRKLEHSLCYSGFATIGQYTDLARGEEA